MPDSEVVTERVRGFADHRFGESALEEWRHFRIDLPASERTDHGKASADYQ
jgi:hypothetical protein